MRSDQTSQFVATRPYKDDRARRNAVREHNSRVREARREAPESKTAKEPELTISGTTVFAMLSGECRIGPHDVEGLFYADSDTHRMLDRSGNRAVAPLCVRHWSEYLRTDADTDDSPVAEVRFSQKMDA